MKSAALAPETAMLLTVKAALPLLVRVTACAALGVPTDCDANVSEAGASVTAGFPALAVPVPERETC